MWYINVVLAVGALVSLLVFGSAAYLEHSRPAARAVSPLADVPLPPRRPKPVVREFSEPELVREVKPGQLPHGAASRTKARHNTW